MLEQTPMSTPLTREQQPTRDELEQALIVRDQTIAALRQQLEETQAECRAIAKIENERAIETMQLKQQLEQAQREIEWMGNELKRLHFLVDNVPEHWKAQLAQQARELGEWRRKYELINNDPDYQQCCQIREQQARRIEALEAQLRYKERRHHD